MSYLVKHAQHGGAYATDRVCSGTIRAGGGHGAPNPICRPDSDLALYVTAEISSAATERPADGPPMIRQTKWSSSVLVPLRKPTVVFSLDDPTTKGQMQLEMTATPIK